MKTCIICDESVENYTCLNSIFYCIKCYKHAITNTKSHITDRIDNLNSFSIGVNDEIAKLKEQITKLTNKLETSTESHYFSGYSLIGEPFKLTEEEAKFFEWDKNVLKMIPMDNDVWFDYLQSKTNDDLKEVTSIVSPGSEQGGNSKSYFSYKNKYYIYINNVLFSYFFGFNKRYSMVKINRNSEFFYLMSHEYHGVTCTD